MNLFELTYFDENGTIRSTDSGTPAWKHSGNTFRNEELGFSFDLENTETELFLASASVKETKSDRIRSLIFEPGMLSPASEGGELILPFGNGVRCRCSGKPEAEALLPLFNRLGGSGNLSLLASVASLLYFTNYASVTPTSGAMPGLKAFVAAVFGGIGSIPGAVIGAFIIGICENIIKGGASIFGIPGSGWTTFSDAFTFAFLIVILVVKPTGLFGEKAVDKV